MVSSAIMASGSRRAVSDGETGGQDHRRRGGEDSARNEGALDRVLRDVLRLYVGAVSTCYSGCAVQTGRNVEVVMKGPRG